MTHSARGAATRQRILEAAASVLARTGELEMVAVAAEAGVSEGLPFHYFGTRSGLLEAVVEDFHTRLADAVVFRAFAGHTWQEREEQRVRAWVRFLLGDPLAPVVLAGMGGDAVVAASWRRRLALAVEAGARNIAHAQRDGDLPTGSDPELLAAAVLGGVQTAVATALGSDTSRDEIQIAGALWTFVRSAAEGSP